MYELIVYQLEKHGITFSGEDQWQVFNYILDAYQGVCSTEQNRLIWEVYDLECANISFKRSKVVLKMVMV